MALVSQSELASIEGFDDDLSNELIKRATAFIEKEKKENLELLKTNGVDDYLLNNELLEVNHLMKLNENDIKTRDQLADLSSFELIEILEGLKSDKADKIIMDSRKHWFKD